MKLVPFITDNAETALAQVHEKLGPNAVVVSVRKLPGHSLSRLLHRPGQIEVLAGVPDDPQPPKVHAVPPGEDAYVPFGDKIVDDTPPSRAPRRWHSITWLESLGLLPELADRLEVKVRARHGDDPPAMPITEWSCVHEVLAGYWRKPPRYEEGSGRPHIFVGPPGSGKTTVLCKWLTSAVLKEDRSVRVWRLDGISANTSEFLSLHCELLGVPVERVWRPPAQPEDLLFIDLPGVEECDSHTLGLLREQLAAWPEAAVHLVLNSAYEVAILFEQMRVFSTLEPDDVIFTHLDEERHRVKLWNFVLGTNCSLSFLSAGQKIPGEFLPAETALLFPHGNRK